MYTYPPIKRTYQLLLFLLLQLVGYQAFAQAPSITAHPASDTICAGANTSFGITATNATSYQWQVNTGSSWSNLSNTGIYSGATTAVLTLSNVSTSYNGYQYRCIATGPSSPAATSNAAILGVLALPTISSTVNDTVCAGDTGRVIANASTGAVVEWYSASTGGTKVGSGDTLTVPSVTTTTTYYAQAEKNGGVSNDSLATAYNTNNGQRGAMFDVLPTTNMTVTGFDVSLYSGTTSDYQIYYKVGTHVGSETTPSDWTPLDTVYSLTSAGNNVPTPMGFNISIPLQANTTYAFYITNTSGGGVAYTDGTAVGNVWASNSDITIYEGTGKSYPFAINFLVRKINATIHYTKGGNCVSSSRTAATITVNPYAVVTTQPSNSSITSGSNTSFSVAATNGTSYQWQVNSGSGWSNVANTGIYSGATTTTLALTGATLAQNSYQYRCIVNQNLCPDTSNTATLSVTGSAPSISSQPPNRTICAGGNTAFSITASGTSITYQWQVNSGSGWSNLSNTGIYSGVTTNTLTLTAATAAYNSYQYRCVVAGSITPNATSNTGTFTVNTAPNITTQPTNSTIGSGSNTSFSLAATGTGLSYQWQVNTGSSWNNLSNTGIYSGVTTNTLTLTGATATQNGYQYRCIVSGTCTPNETSNAVTLTVNTAPAITAQPTNSTICAGSNTTFSITATNATAYQWQVNTGSGWNNLSNTGIYSGVTTNTLTLTAATAAYNSYQYRCVVTGTTTPNATSNAATLTVNTAPNITTQPANSTIGSGSNTSFTVAATGTGLNYQWQVNTGSSWSNLSNTGIYSGVTTNTLSLTGATATQNGYQYRCIVSGTCTPNETSNAVTLTVNTAPAITAQPTNSTICSGSNTTFSVTATNATAYQWQVNTGSGWANISNTGIYSGATTNTLTLTGATTTQTGYQYRCEVTGATTPNAISNAATLTINVAPSITAQPTNSTICDGSNTTFNVTAANATGYQWQINTGSGWSNLSNTGIYSGVATSSLSLTAAGTAVDGYQYRCIASGACMPNATSNAATISVNTLPAITAQPTNDTICPGDVTNFSISATGTGLTYQWESDLSGTWTPISNGGMYSGATSANFTITGATNAFSNRRYRCVVSGTCSPSVTSSVATLTVNSRPHIYTTLTNDTICEYGTYSIYITTNGTGLTYQWQVNTGSGWNNLSNTGIYTGATTSTLSFTGTTIAEDGNQYRCILNGVCTPSDTSNSMTLKVNNTLSYSSISAHPSNTTVCSGGNTGFSVTASGTNVVYQWQVNNGSGWNNISNTGIYSGATTSTLSLTGATNAQNGYQYRCKMSDDCSSAINSNQATLTINSIPDITSQSSTTQVACAGTNTSFNVSATGTTLSYLWQVNTGSSWNNISNTGIYGGAASNTLTITGVPSAANGYQYRCIVSGICNPADTSNTISLQVDTTATISSDPIDSTVCDGQNAAFIATIHNITNAATSYIWQVNAGGGWSNVSNAGIYSGATTRILSLTGVPSSANGYQYRCILSGPCNTADTSIPATITVNSSPTITTQPGNSTVCENTNTSFTAQASGSGIGYQWQVNSGSGWNNVSNTGIYSGATTTTLSLTSVSTAYDSYQYRCLIASTCATDTPTVAATLTVNSLPVITSQPTNQTICNGSSTSFNISATGTGIGYQWQVNTGSGWNNLSNTGVYSGATSNTLTLTGAPNSYTGYQYRCIVSGTCNPSATSGTATITVNSSPTIATQPVNRTVCENTNTSFIAQATGTGIGYQWQVNTGSGWNSISNTGIYSGATAGTLTLTGVTTAYSSYQYRCMISSTCAADTPTSSATLTVNSLPVITSQPSNDTICDGSNSSFSITATGTAINYQWQVNNGSGWNNISNTGIYAGAMSNTLSLTATTTSYSGYQYRCVVSGACSPAATSGIATLVVDGLPTVTTNPTNKTVCAGSNTSFTAVGTAAGLTYQWQINTGSGWNNVSNGGLYSGATTGTLSITAATTSIDGAQYRCVLSGKCPPSVNTSAATITVNTLPSITTQPSNKVICDGNNTSFSVAATGTALTYRWQVNTGSGWNNVSNGTVYSGATTNTLSLSAPNTSYDGYQYRCIVSGACSPAVTSNGVNLTVHPIVTPSISITSTATTICAGTSVTFNVSATSNAGSTPSYQWKVNGSNVGSNSTSYTTTGLANGDVVTCVLTTSAPCPTSPTATSNGITMTVNPLLLPTISINSATGDSVCDTRMATFSASITNGGSAPIFKWSVNGNTVGINSNGYSTSGLSDGDVISCELTSNALCATPKVVNSNKIKMTVIPLSYATAQIKATPTTGICEGDEVIVYPYYTNPGANPTFDWYVNGAFSATTVGAYKTKQFQNGDQVYCIYTNGNLCPVPVTTNTETMTVDVTHSSSVSISVSSGNIIAPGWLVTFTATPTDEGANPTYRWRKNGQYIPGANSASYTTSDLEYGDKIDLVMKSDWKCSEREYELSNVIKVNIPAAVENTAILLEDLKLYPNPNQGSFHLRGTYNLSGEHTANIKVYNALGQMVYKSQANIMNGKLDHQVDISGQSAAGMYMVEIVVEDQINYQKFNIIE